ncbi:MAG: BMP family ABC transporter substrate-binding protein [Actinomycetota bacterium]|nr:BMP family ABC transporter substrate-binding protein [Actinomycetota bacterium]
MAFGLVAAACGSDGGDSASSGGSDVVATTAAPATTGAPAATAAPVEDPVIVGYVLSGPTNDGGFYEDQANGTHTVAAELGYEVRIVENAFDPADQVAGMRNMANEGATLILGDGLMSDSAATVAKEFPDIEFVIITAPRFEAVDNLSAYVVSQGVPSYVMGVVAAEISETGNAGYIGGFEFSAVAETRAGFFQGFMDSGGATTADINVGDFNDVVGAKDAAAAQIANDIDVIYAFVDAGFPGVVQAVDESGTEVGLWGATVSHCPDGPDKVVGNAIANSEQVLRYLMNAFNDGALPHDNVFYGIEDPLIQHVELCPGFEEHQGLVDATTAAILSGAVVLDPAVTGG